MTFFLVVTQAACGAVASDHGFSSDTDGWPETIEDTNPWPTFGSSGPLAPRWTAPQRMGCSERVYVRHEPDRAFAPGDGPATVYGDVVGSECRPPGVVVTIVDEAGYAEADLFRGDCATGIQLAVGSPGVLATVSFASDVECAAFERTRTARDGAPSTEHVTTTLRLLDTGAVVSFAFVATSTARSTAAFTFTSDR